MVKKVLLCALAGFCAGAVTGLFGAGGGMVLVPLLTLLTDLEERDIFPVSISVIAPICVVALLRHSAGGPLPWQEAAPYLAGSGIGGLLAGKLGQKIPVVWLHRLLGCLILWGGARYLWQNPL